MPDHEYLSIAFVNNDTQGIEPYQQIVFRETRDIPLISRDAEYYLSVQKFSLHTSLLPSLIAQIEPFPNTDPNLTIYTVSMSYEYLGTTYTETVPLIWKTQTPNENVSNPSPSLTQDLSGMYYYLFDYVHFLSILNTAYDTCYTNLNTTVVGAGGSLPGTAKPPYMEFDANNQKFILNAPEDAYDFDTPMGDYIKIYMNAPLYFLFNGLEKYNNGTIGDLQYQLIVRQLFGNVYSFGGTNYLQSYQPYSSLPNWSPVTEIAFTSNTIGVRSLNVGKENSFNSPSGSLTSNGTPITTNVLTTFTVNELQWSNYVLYVPSGQNRYIDLRGATDLREIDIRIVWKDKFGNNREFLSAPGEQSNILLLFRRKGITD